MRGIVRCILPRGDANARARLRDTLAAPTTATRIGERLHRELWPSFWTASPSDSIAARIRDTFDPQSILNPGVLGLPA
jgi:FAD/FMN-containing dehydrogenase